VHRTHALSTHTNIISFPHALKTLHTCIAIMHVAHKPPIHHSHNLCTSIRMHRAHTFCLQPPRMHRHTHYTYIIPTHFIHTHHASLAAFASNPHTLVTSTTCIARIDPSPHPPSHTTDMHHNHNLHTNRAHKSRAFTSHTPRTCIITTQFIRIAHIHHEHSPRTHNGHAS
jgi:hypothetical protein